MAVDVQVAHVRSFNRVVTQRIGALDDHYLGRDRPLGQNGVLWEIGATGCEVRSIPEPLEPGQRDELMAAMRTVKRLLTTTEIELRTVDPAVAYRHGEAVGCGGVKHHPGAPSEIKRMWVAENARGLGIVRRLLAALEADAIRSGATVARIETGAPLVEAIALYRSTGYVEVAPFNAEPFADHWFEKQL